MLNQIVNDDAPSTARLAGVVDFGCAGHPGKLVEIVRAPGKQGDTDKAGALAELACVKVMRIAGAAHVQRRIRARASLEPEVGKIRFHLVEVGHAKANECDVADLEERRCHRSSPARGCGQACAAACARVSPCSFVSRIEMRSSSVWLSSVTPKT